MFLALGIDVCASVLAYYIRRKSQLESKLEGMIESASSEQLSAVQMLINSVAARYSAWMAASTALEQLHADVTTHASVSQQQSGSSSGPGAAAQALHSLAAKIEPGLSGAAMHMARPFVEAGSAAAVDRSLEIWGIKFTGSFASVFPSPHTDLPRAIWTTSNEMEAANQIVVDKVNKEYLNCEKKMQEPDELHLSPITGNPQKRVKRKDFVQETMALLKTQLTLPAVLTTIQAFDLCNQPSEEAVAAWRSYASATITKFFGRKRWLPPTTVWGQIDPMQRLIVILRVQQVTSPASKTY